VFRRALLAVVGFAVLAVYLGLAWALLTGYAWLLANPPDPLAVTLALGVAVLLTASASYHLGTARLLAGVETRELPRRRAPSLYRRQDRLCHDLGIEPPSLLVADLGAPNALSIGGPRRSAIVLDRRLFSLLSADELEGILAHELAHVAGRDAFLQTLAVAVMRTLSGVAFLLLLPVTLVAVGVGRATAWVSGRPERGADVAALATLGVQLLVGLVLSAFTLALLARSRRREFDADARAAELTGRPRALARALVKIHRAADPRLGLRSLLTVQGEESDVDWRRWISTHPPVEARVARLVGGDFGTRGEPGDRNLFAGGRVP
jgi:heat shock protein HtpX